MKVNGNWLILMGFVGISLVTSIYFINKNTSNGYTTDSVALIVEENTKNIKQIKHSLDQLLDLSQTKNLDTANNSNKQLVNIDNHIQKLINRYNGLSDEIQSIKQKSLQEASQTYTSKESENSLVKTEDSILKISPNIIQHNIEDEKKKITELGQHYEENWQLGSNDIIAATEMQSELNAIFTPDQKGVTVLDSDCKSSGCKITLEVTDEFLGGSPVAMLVDSEKSIFKNKDFFLKENTDPSTGETEITLYVTKTTDEENL